MGEKCVCLYIKGCVYKGVCVCVYIKGCVYIKDWFKPIFPLFLSWLLCKLKFLILMVCRSQWPRGLRRRSTRLLRLWVRIPPGAWKSVCCECCVLSGRGLCDGLITRPEESYRLWCVVVCDLETSWMKRPWPTGGCGTKNKQILMAYWSPPPAASLPSFIPSSYLFPSVTSIFPLSFVLYSTRFSLILQKQDVTFHR